MIFYFTWTLIIGFWDFLFAPVLPTFLVGGSIFVWYNYRENGVKNFSKKQLIGGVFVFLILGGGVLYVNVFERKGVAQISPPLTAESTLRAEAEKDSDKDGLKDWEETLWKTDAANPDSDGDGTEDGEEVRTKRNPTKPGPDDEYKSIEESPLKDVVAEITAEQNLTLTDIFTRDFLTGYFALKNTNNYTPETRDRFLKTLVGNAVNVTSREDTIKDLTLVQKSDKNTLRIYGNALGEVAVKYRHLAEGKELSIVDDAVKQESREKLAELEPILADYEAFINTYRALPVPLVAYEVHLALLNVNALTRDALVKMSRLFDDPIGGAAGVKEYRKAAQDGAVVVRDLKNFFEEKGVVFNDNDPGSIFNK